MPGRLQRAIQLLQSGWRAYAVLALVLAAAYLALALRGFRLGFYSDIVAYQYHFELRGVVGGMNWLITEYWQRHLLGGLFAIPLHLFGPDRYELWYALTLALHFLVGPFVFLLVDTLQCGQRRWLGFAIALAFIFDPLQTPSNVEFPTGWDHRIFLIWALLSLWAYLRFIRSRRRQAGWYMLSFLTYMLAIMTYEQSFFFFLLHPVIALVEERRPGEPRLTARNLWLHARDALPYAFFLLIYVYLLRILFSGDSFAMSLSPGHLARQTAEGIAVIFNPLDLASRLAQAAAMGKWWLVALLALVVGAFFQLWIPRSGGDSQSAVWTPPMLAGLGLLLALLSIFNSAPTNMPLALHTRLLFAASLGQAFVLIGLLGSAVDRNRRIGGTAFAAALALLLAPAISFFYEHQAIHLQRAQTSERVFASIFDAIPEYAAGAEPYLMLVTDRDAETDLYLHPRDVNFPRVFALHYGIANFRADAVLFDHDGARKPARIELREEGIVSPLQPGELIGYDSVIVVAYQSADNSVTVLDRLPDEVLQQGNFKSGADVRIETNWSLLP